MPLLTNSPRNVGVAGRALRAALTAFTSLLLITCTDNPSAPGGAGMGQIRVYPTFDASARMVPLALDNIRILVIRPPNDTIKTVTQSFPANQNQIQVTASQIPLQSTSEDLIVVIELYSGTTLLFSGTDTVAVEAGVIPPAAAVPVTYAGPGSNVDSLQVSPRDTTVPPGAVVPFTVQGFAAGSPLPQFYVSWSATAGTIDPVGSYTAPAALGTYFVHAASPTATSAVIKDSTTITVAILVPGRTWTGAVSTDWHTAGNWSPAQVPGLADDVTIPVTSNQPVVSTTANMNDLTIAAGASVTLATTFTFNVAGNLAANGNLLVSGGTPTIQLSGTGKTLLGQVANASITGTIALAGNTTVSGNVAVSGGTATLNVGIALLQVSGNFSTGSGGRLIMTTAGGQLAILGSAAFGGGDENGALTAGTITIAGNFSQTGSGNAASFAASGSHSTGFIGATASHTVNFGTPGAGTTSSHFNTLDISNTATLSLATDAFANGLFLSTPSGAAPTLGTTGATHKLTAAGVSVTGLVVNQATLAIGGGSIVAFNSVQFTNMPTTVAQLTVNHPGAATPFTFTSLSFATTPVAPNGFYMDVTDADGLAPSLVINMVGATPATPSGFVRTTGGAAVNWPSTLPIITWDGSASTLWSDVNNWTPAQVPSSTDDVLIPAGTPNNPIFSVSCSVKTLTVNTGASFNLGTGNCTAAGNVFADGAITGTGAIAIATPAQIRGNFPSLILSGKITQSATVTATGNLTVTGTAGSYVVGGQSLTVGGNLNVQSSARLVMLSPSDLVNVLGNAVFSGGFELDSLNAGVLSIGGNLTQNTGSTGDTYHTSGTHQTIFTGNNPTIFFATPGDVPGTSHFQQFTWAGTGTLNLTSDAYAHVSFTTTSTSPVIISGATHLLQVGNYVGAGPITFSNTRLGLNEPTGGPLALSNATFQGLANTAIQLTVNHPGTGGPFTFNNLTFSVTPTGAGRYISATDQDGPSPTPLTINVTNSTPTSPGGFVTVTNGAVVNWPPVAPAPTWLGTVSTDWNVAGNWSSGVVPSPTDSVVIPIVGNQPTLTANAFVGAVNITGGTLTLNGRILTVARTFATTGAGTVTMTNLVDSLRVSGNASFGGGNETNLLSAGIITIAGNLNQAGNAGSFAATGTHGTIFTGSPTITFANPGSGLGFSHFQELGLLRPSALILASDLVVEGSPHGFGIGTLSLIGSGQSLTLRGNGGGGGGGPDSGAVVFNNVRLIIDQVSSTIDTLDDFVFQGLPSTATQLTIRHPGGATPVGLRNVTFNTLPTTGGFYISATDVNTSDGVPLVVDVINGSPASGAPFVQVTGGATVNWPANPTPIWDGSQGNSDWNDPLNWSTNLVPGSSDSVVIPNVGSQPVLFSPVSVGAVNISGGNITINRNTLTVARTFATTGIGTLTMNLVNDRVDIGGDAIFAGAGGGALDSGRVTIGGNFTQLNTNSPASYAATCGHQTEFINPAPTISFATPGPSHFGTLLGTFGQTFTLGSSVTVECLINGGDGFGGVIKGGGTTTLTAQQIFSGGVTFDGAQLVINDPTGIGFGLSNVDFINQPNTAVQLTVIHPGFVQGTAYTLGNINWTPLTGTDPGFYVSAVDPDGGSLAALLVDIFGNNPGNGPAFTKTDGTATVTWQGAPIIWSGGSDNDSWTDPSNWVGGVVPTASDNAQIPAGTPFDPRVTGTQAVKDLSVLSGATLVINDATLQVLGSVTANGTITQSGGGVLSLTGSGQTAFGTLGPVSVEAGASYSLSGLTFADNVGVSGVLNLNGSTLFVSTDLNTNGNGVLVMQNPSDQVIVTGNAQFNGGSTVGSLTNGSLSVGGSFFQTNTTSTASFFATGNHVVQLIGATPQIVNLAGAGSGSQFSTLTVGPGGMTAQTDLQFFHDLATGGGPIDMAGHKFTVAGNFTTAGTGTLVMQNPADQLIVTGAAVFAGGSTAGLMTDGVLSLGAGLDQLNAGGSNLSFAPSGLHRTITGITGTISFQTPGTGAAGSHFNALDVTAATGGLAFTTGAFVDSALIVSVGAAAPKISGVGVALTAKQWLVANGLQVTNIPMVLNEGGVTRTHQFSNVSFLGFPTSPNSVALIDVTAVGTSLSARTITFTGTQLQTTLGTGGLYVRAASSNAAPYTLIMSGSNDPTGGFSRSQQIAPAVIQYQ